ncbi:MAG: thrombospondin type 3 repeat-containing protein, partial [Deltaproteobacteria bacterium]|nr:thrombospondin type 3 repeat-containing protein [Deltaproteobacteria bacterium]
MTRILCLLAMLSACSIDVGKFDDRRCQSDVQCRPDEACRESLCAQTTCTTYIDCGAGYQYECEVGGCVVTACVTAAECELGFSCRDGFCATECTGRDVDGDGICDAVDNCVSAANRNQTDTDRDLRGDACDRCPNDAENDGDNDSICGDLDNCKFAANPSQVDRDNDGMGNECDGDDDADGQVDALDPAPLDPDRCGDADADSCDDCSIGTDDLGPLVDRMPSNDGPDADSDGACDAGDLDDDNDGVNDATDPAATDPNVCGDSDTDTCDDCVVGSDDFGPLADNLAGADGADHDSDGQCDAGDPDDDNDQRPDGVDACALGVTAWISSGTTDIDLDGCRDVGEDCNTCTARCGATCTDTDSDAQPDCLEQHCGSDPLVLGSACVLVGSEAAMNAALASANTTTNARDFLLINASYTVAGDP